eukprot:7797013-Pyramimonas_sp.AAC.1
MAIMRPVSRTPAAAPSTPPWARSTLRSLCCLSSLSNTWHSEHTGMSHSSHSGSPATSDGSV